MDFGREITILVVFFAVAFVAFLIKKFIDD